jgi:hypothetical protein
MAPKFVWVVACDNGEHFDEYVETPHEVCKTEAIALRRCAELEKAEIAKEEELATYLASSSGRSKFNAASPHRGRTCFDFTCYEIPYTDK